MKQVYTVTEHFFHSGEEIKHITKEFEYAAAAEEAYETLEDSGETVTLLMISQAETREEAEEVGYSIALESRTYDSAEEYKDGGVEAYSKLDIERECMFYGTDFMDDIEEKFGREHEILQERQIDIEGGQIPVTFWRTATTYGASIDGVQWFELDYTEQVHAAVLYNMLADHITEYYHYRHL